MEHPSMTSQDRQKHGGNLDVMEFLDVMYVLLESVRGKGWGQFVMEKPKTLDPKNVSLPIITYQVEKIVPGDAGNGKLDRKPRHRGTFNLTHNDTEEIVTVTEESQRIDATVTFTIYADNNKKALEESQTFVEIINEHKSILMEYGLNNIWFEKDEAVEVNSREYVVARELTYIVRFEKIYQTVHNTIKDIKVKADVLKHEYAKEGLLPSQQDPSLEEEYKEDEI